MFSSKKFLIIISCAVITAGLFALFARAQTSRLANPSWFTLRNLNTGQEITNPLWQVLNASSTDQLLLKWPKVGGGENYWYSSDLTRNDENLFQWARLNTENASDKGDHFELAFSASYLPEGTHWFQITACPSNPDECSRADSGYPYLYVWLNVSGETSVLPSSSATGAFQTITSFFKSVGSGIAGTAQNIASFFRI